MTATNPRETPYKGLVPYAESDYRLFFGRDSERDVITANIMGSRLTIVYGPSGVGKSSLLRAGVVHGIREMARAEIADIHEMAHEEIDDLHETEHEEVAANGAPSFVVAFFNQWRDEPLTGLRNEIRSSVQNATGKKLSIPTDISFAEELKELSKFVSGKLLIILDQFEEYFLYPQKDGEGSFAYDFPLALSRPDVRANFIVSLREDWYTKLDRFKTSIPHLFDNNLRVDWLNREGARQAIEEPVRIYNEELKNGSPEVKINPGFAAEVLNQLEALAERNVVGEAVSGDAKVSKGKGSIQTPYLQLVMNQLWSEAISQAIPELDASMLKAPVSGERGKTRSEEIIQSHLDSMMKSLSREQQDVAARAFYHLVTPGGTKIAQQIGDLVDYTELPESTLNPVLQALSRKEMSILTQLMPPPNKPSNQVRYELFHDVLAPAILNWRTRFNAERSEEKARVAAQLRLEQQRIEAAELAAEKEKELKAAQQQAEIQRQRAEDQKARVEAESRARMAEQERAEAEKTRAEEHLRTSTRLGRLSLGLAFVVVFAFAASVFAGVMWRRSKESEDRALAGQSKAEESAKLATLNEDKAKLKEAEAMKFAKESQRLRAEGIASEVKAQKMTVLAARNLEAANRARKAAAAAENRARIDRATAQHASEQAEEMQQFASVFRLESLKARQDAYENRQQAQQARDLNVLYQDALVKYRSKDYQGTIDTLTSALPKITTGSIDQANALTLIGYSYSDLDKPSEAVDAFSKALQIFQANKDVSAEANALKNLGESYSSIKDAKPKAIENYQLAIAAYEKAGKPEQAASALVALGDTYIEKDFYDTAPGDTENAENAYRKAVTIYASQNDTENAAQTLIKVAKLFERFEEPAKLEKAYVAYGQAATTYEKAKEDRKAASTLDKLAELQRKHDKLDLAEQNYEKGVNVLEQGGHLSRAASMLRSIGAMHGCKECDNERKRKAANAYRRAVGLYERIDPLSTADRRYLNSSLSALVRIYTALGDKALADVYAQRLNASRTDSK